MFQRNQVIFQIKKLGTKKSFQVEKPNNIYKTLKVKERQRERNVSKKNFSKGLRLIFFLKQKDFKTKRGFTFKNETTFRNK